MTFKLKVLVLRFSVLVLRKTVFVLVLKNFQVIGIDPLSIGIAIPEALPILRMENFLSIENVMTEMFSIALKLNRKKIDLCCGCEEKEISYLFQPHGHMVCEICFRNRCCKCCGVFIAEYDKFQ